MKSQTVQDFMVPIAEYATVPLGTSLYEATLVLEQAQEAFDGSKYQHRAILVMDNDKVVGKISQLRVLRALDMDTSAESILDELRNYNFSYTYIEALREKHRLKKEILSEGILAEAAKMKVEDFMQAPTQCEIIAASASLDMAIHKLVSGTHQSLLVTKRDKIIGVLRSSDVFAAVFHAMKEGELTRTAAAGTVTS